MIFTACRAAKEADCISTLEAGSAEPSCKLQALCGRFRKLFSAGLQMDGA